MATEWLLLWKEWLDLKRSYVDIDWSQVEEENYVIEVNTIGGEACSGGKCDLGALGDSINAKNQETKAVAKAG